MTPHEAEAARLLNVRVSEIRSSREDAAEAIARKYTACCVLKGKGTLIVSPEGKIFMNETGNPGMATGGSGDVLTGILASFLAQFKTVFPVDPVCAAVYIHGLAGDLAARELGEYGLLAGDIASHVPFAIKDIVNP